MSQPIPTSHTDDFVTRYLNGGLADYFALRPGDTEGALAQPRPVDRGRLSAALGSYAERLAAPPAVFDSLARLAEPESRVVVTGQQAGLLLGPSYSLAKAASAVALARSLSTEARPVLPVFWLASQDHDTTEVDHAFLLDLDERLTRVQLPLPAGRPAGRIPLELQWAASTVEDLKRLEVPRAHRDEVCALLMRTAERADSFADWFGALLFELLGPQGLIVLDPLEPEVAPLFDEVIAAELQEPLASSRAINEAAARLHALGLTAQLGRGEEATNLFIEEGDAQAAQRRLLRFDGAGFYTEADRYSRAQLQEVLEREPGRLTPAAGLRPVTQDTALPTAATVVGPGELRYFSQLKDVYARHGVAMPLLWPRASVTVLEPPVRRILDKFGLSYPQLAADFEGCREQALLELHGHAEVFRETTQALQAATDDLLRHIRAIDPTLERTVERGEAHIQRTLDILRRKSAAALTKHDSIYVRQWQRLEIHLFPDGVPQERLISPFSFFLKFGVQPVVDGYLSLPASGEHVLTLV